MVGCYIDRPNADYENRKYAVLDSMYCAEFLRYYSFVKRNHNLDNDDQPEELTSKITEENLDQHLSKTSTTYVIRLKIAVQKST